jgi:chromosome segregation ATPase
MDLGVAQSEVDTYKHRLQDSETNLVSVGAVIDGLQERLEVLLAEKLKVEDELRSVQEEIGNRSTESEARARDEELFQLKEELDGYKESMANTRKELEGRIFVKDKDIEEARASVATLQSTIANLENANRRAETRHVHLLHDKIGRLRSERDELRVSLNFIQHEHRFARQALESDKLVAVGELQDVKNVVREKTESLERALLDLGRVVQLEDELRDAITLRDELALQEEKNKETLKSNQAQLRSNALELGTLANHLALSSYEASKAQSEKAQLQKTARDLEQKINWLQEDKEVLSGMTGQNGDTSENASAVKVGQIGALWESNAALQDRLTRREGQLLPVP